MLALDIDQRDTKICFPDLRVGHTRRYMSDFTGVYSSLPQPDNIAFGSCTHLDRYVPMTGVPRCAISIWFSQCLQPDQEKRSPVSR
jgi:hypothetical protein